MALTEEKRRYLEQVVGKEKLAEIEAKDSDRSKALEDMKVAYKDFAQVTPPAKPTDTETQKTFGALFTDVVTMQDEMLQVMALQKKAIEAKDTQIAALKTEKDSEIKQLADEVKSLRELVNAPPQRPSQSNSTRIDPDKSTLKDVTPKEPDTFFGDLFGKSSAAGAK